MLPLGKQLALAVAEVEELHGCGGPRGSTLTRSRSLLLPPRFPGVRDFSRFR
ncbi:hypothetical protein NDA00_28885 [Funiculus sociatus GB2-M2]